MVVQVNYDEPMKQVADIFRWFSVGIDMHQNMWSLGILDRLTGKYSNFCCRGRDKEQFAYAKIKALIDQGYTVKVSYEAGRSGFTPAREMRALGAEVAVVPVGKLEVIQSGKKVKTDKLDTRFYSYIDIADKAIPKAYVPSVPEECDRMMIREHERLSEDIGRKNNQILAILERWPIARELDERGRHHSASQWSEQLEQWREQSWISDESLPQVEARRITNMVEELELLEKQRKDWEQYTTERLDEQRQAAADRGEVHAVDKLTEYTGIGERSALKLVWTISAFDRFGNGKKFASYFGLTPTPWQSDGRGREQGISKAGRSELRALAIELGWLWRQWQPRSALTEKWEARLRVKGRSRRTAIVALTRQLMVALYRLVVHGEELEGAVKNKPLAA